MAPVTALTRLNYSDLIALCVCCQLAEDFLLMAPSEGGKETESRMREDTQERRHDYGKEETQINEIIGEIHFSTQQQKLL